MYTFYGSKSAMQLNLAFTKGTGRISIANKLPSAMNKKGRPQKGEKIFDWDNAIYFALEPTEAHRLLIHLQYSRFPDGSDDRDDLFTISHYPVETTESGKEIRHTSHLVVGRRKFVENGAPTFQVTITLVRTYGEDQKDKASFTLRDVYEIEVFKNFLRLIGYLPFIQDIAGVIAYNWPKGKAPWNEKSSSTQQRGNSYNGKPKGMPKQSTSSEEISAALDDMLEELGDF